jgi:PLD-like domain
MTCLSSPTRRARIGFRIGWTDLLSEFLDLCASSGPGILLLVAPFMDEALIEGITARLTMQRVNLCLIVSGEDVAGRLRMKLHPRYCSLVTIRLCDHLHAKVYIFETATHELVGLIGSHNPTRAGTTTNLEVGVLMRASCGTSEWLMLADLRDSIYARSQPETDCRARDVQRRLRCPRP